MGTRIERDSIGELEVPSDKYYGAQTQRSLENFKIGGEVFQREFIRAYGLIKKAASSVNHRFGNINDKILNAIHKASDEVISGTLDVPEITSSEALWIAFRILSLILPNL